MSQLTDVGEDKQRLAKRQRARRQATAKRGQTADISGALSVHQGCERLDRQVPDVLAGVENGTRIEFSGARGQNPRQRLTD